jgi:hypothetical protein
LVKNAALGGGRRAMPDEIRAVESYLWTHTAPAVNFGVR